MKEMTEAKKSYIMRKAPLIMVAALQGGRPLHRDNMDLLVTDAISAARILADKLEDRLDFVFADPEDWNEE